MGHFVPPPPPLSNTIDEVHLISSSLPFVHDSLAVSETNASVSNAAILHAGVPIIFTSFVPFCESFPRILIFSYLTSRCNCLSSSRFLQQQYHAVTIVALTEHQFLQSLSPRSLHRFPRDA